MNRLSRTKTAVSVGARVFAVLALAFSAWSTALAQDAGWFAAPIVWKKYGITSQGVTAEFPKFPTADVEISPCERLQAEHYFAYADQAVYRLTIFSRLKDLNTRGCTRVSYFGERSLRVRLQELYNGQPVVKGEAKVGDKVLPAYEFTVNNTIYRIIDDVKKGKWIEMSVYYRVADNSAVSRFFDSLALTADNSAIEIKGGWSRTRGDDPVSDPLPETPEPASGSTDAEDGVNNYRLIYKPKARYTDAARNGNVQGTVRVKVVLLHNGGIGDVTVVKGLSRGLTEQAVKAARRLVFLPKVRGGKTVSVMVTVEYSFNIY
ncbi:MAG TPA: energy transducer TonB [Pyrinomonadaceae bacterium]|nr:energy transducer TonB [Pyrinomonadaceae bacterium]